MSRRSAPRVDLHAYVPTLVVDLANALWRTGAAFYRRRFARCPLDRQAAILDGLPPEDAAALSGGLRRLLADVDRRHGQDRAAGR